MKLRDQHKMFVGLLCGAGFFLIFGLIIFFVFGDSFMRRVVGSGSAGMGVALLIVAYVLERRFGSAWRELARFDPDDVSGGGF